MTYHIVLLIVLYVAMTAVKYYENEYRNCCDGSLLSFFYHRYESFVGSMYFLLMFLSIFVIWQIVQMYPSVETIFSASLWFLIAISMIFGGVVVVGTIIESLAPAKIIRFRPSEFFQKTKDFVIDEFHDARENLRDFMSSTVVKLLTTCLGLLILYETGASTYNNIISP